MSPKQQLEAARALIEDPKRWTRKVPGIDKVGVPTCPQSSACRRWCAYGALEKVAGTGKPTYPALSILERTCQDMIRERDDIATPGVHEAITVLNDDLGHRAVLDAFDRAIENASECTIEEVRWTTERC